MKMPTLAASPTTQFPSAFGNYQPPSFKVYGAICVSKNDRILLVRGKNSRMYSFPKGHLKRGESAEQCAERELKEETGLPLQGKALGFYKFSAGSYFLYQFETEPTPAPQDSWEVDMARWVRIDELDSLPCNVDVSWFRTVMRGHTKRTEKKDVDNASSSLPLSNETWPRAPSSTATTEGTHGTMEYMASRQARREIALLWRRRTAQ